MALTVPVVCGRCQSRNVVPHCETSPNCPWIHCQDCRHVTGIAFGEPRVIPALRMTGGR